MKGTIELFLACALLAGISLALSGIIPLMKVFGTLFFF